MVERTQDQLIDQMTYALACVYQHYGPGLNSDGLKDLRLEMTQLFSKNKLFLDASYRTDVNENDPYVDFDQRILKPNGWYNISFDEFKQELNDD